MALVCWFAVWNVLPRYIRKVPLHQRRQFLISESEILVQWRRFVAATWIEWKDHARRSLWLVGMLKTLCDLPEECGHL